MKICFVTPRYVPHTGGIVTNIRQVSDRLVERNHEVVVLTADASDSLPAIERRNSVEIRRHRSFAPNGAFHVAPGITRSVRQVDADVIHAHNYHSLPLLFAALAIRDERFVVTPHYHGGSASSFRDRLLSLYDPIGRWALRQADAVLAVSEWEQEQLVTDFGVEATVIPNGIELDHFRDVEPEKRERPYVLCVGRLEEYKGIEYMIQAMAELPGWELVIAGTGPHRERLEEICEELGMTDRVSFLGYVEDDRLPRLYTGAEVFLALSEFEAYGLTVGEALASGTPCVVYEAGALVDWTSADGCIGIRDRSPAEVAKAIHLAEGTHVDAEGILDWSEVTDRLLANYAVSDDS